MSSRNYLRLYLLLTLLVCLESYLWNFFPTESILGKITALGYLPAGTVDPTPGRALSRALGWAGVFFILLTNIYLIKKSAQRRTNGKGSLRSWLNFHIFCGLLGATLIVFHTNFKVGGLVAVAFWSMMVCFASGIAGRYLYSFVALQKADLAEKTAAEEAWLEKQLGERARRLIDAWDMQDSEQGSPIVTLGKSLRRDMMLLLMLPRLRRELGAEPGNVAFDCFRGKLRLKRYEQFRLFIGYWHAFHRPFALFMYSVAAIHIVTATLMGVGDSPRAQIWRRKEPVKIATPALTPAAKKQRAGDSQ